jgi:hypothetical protein
MSYTENARSMRSAINELIKGVNKKDLKKYMQVIPKWRPDTPYLVGDIVRDKNLIFTCTKGHISGKKIEVIYWDGDSA